MEGRTAPSTSQVVPMGVKPVRDSCAPAVPVLGASGVTQFASLGGLALLLPSSYITSLSLIFFISKMGWQNMHPSSMMISEGKGAPS